MLLLSITVFVISAELSQASVGDSSPFYQKCVDRCILLNCTQSGADFIEGYQQPVAQQIMRWSCTDECTYECMWKTVDAFKARDWNVPQFRGKWPFIRLYGVQEPASAIFSLFNFLANWKMLKRLRKEVRSDAPCYWLWHAFNYVCLNCWFWSTVFHTRDTNFTEVMDYCCAFSMVLMMCYCMTMRIFMKLPKVILVFLSVLFLLFLANHVAYLSLRYRIDYTYNMQLNVAVGISTALSWFAWCTWNRHRLPHVWKCALFVALQGVFLLLEVADVPPIFWIFDCHSLWHLSSVPSTILFYLFVIDDCKYLRKQRQYSEGSGDQSNKYNDIRKLLKKA